MALSSNEWKIAEPSIEQTSVTYSPNPSAKPGLSQLSLQSPGSNSIQPHSCHLRTVWACKICSGHELQPSRPPESQLYFNTHLHHYLHLLKIHFTATFPQKHLCDSSVQQALLPVIHLQGWMLEQLKVKQEVSNWAGRRTRLLIPNPLLEVLRELPDFLLHS